MPSSLIHSYICAGPANQVSTCLKTQMTNLAKLWRGNELCIELSNHYNSKVHESGSPVTGSLVISPCQDIQLAHVKVALLGESRVCRESVVNRSSTARYRFLKVDLPIPQSAYPPSETFLAGNTYKIPFNFVIPYELPSTGCAHHVNSVAVKDHHLRLPPTVGDWEKDDMAPESIQIQYSITASLHHRQSLKQPYSQYRETSKAIRVVAPSMEQPPLAISPSNKFYCLKRTKDIYKGLLSGCLGRVDVVATQAQTIHLYPDMRGMDESSVPIALTFAPIALDVIPPQIKSMTAKIRSHTWYKPSQMSHFPDQYDKGEPYITAVPLEVSSPEKLIWAQHLDLASQSASRDGAPPMFHTTTSQISFRLPVLGKTFLPTFHSCLVSRTYSIHLCLNINNAFVELSIPIQIAVDTTRNPEFRDDSVPDVEVVPAYS